MRDPRPQAGRTDSSARGAHETKKNDRKMTVGLPCRVLKRRPENYLSVLFIFLSDVFPFYVNSR
jgi:hypothetical protein